MLILGWNGGRIAEREDAAPGWSRHDGAAVLIRDGHLVAAIEEERLNRIKHSNFFPYRSIKRCLEIGKVDLGDVDIVATNSIEKTGRLFPGDAGLPFFDLFLDDASVNVTTVRDYIAGLFSSAFRHDVSGKLFFCEHHLAHLWSAWGMAGFDESLVVSLDGSGDSLSGMVAVGRGADMQVVRKLSIDQSLGNLYSDSIRLLGYRRFDEYKVMGLAPYGDPERFQSLFSQFFTLLPDGDYRLLDRSDRWNLIYNAGLVAQARRASAPFGQMHRDLAAALQRTLETIALHVFRHFATSTGLTRLCYAGGVAHNCTLNGRLLYEGIFEEVFVQPAAHDAGGAMGAALAASSHLGSERLLPLRHLFLGAALPLDLDLERELRSWEPIVTITQLEDPARAAAQMLADGKVLGWVQERSEFGPRALGHRSIIADPRPAENKDRINRMVKKRESYRPFAPSVLEEHLGELIDLPSTKTDYSHMTFSLQVREARRGDLAAVTHVDGSSRIQSVSSATDPTYWRLIDSFRELTGVPAILNTSFNNDAEPIVDSVADAVVCYLTTDIDALVVGRFLVHKPSETEVERHISDLYLALPASRKLVVRAEQRVYTLESTAGSHFTAKRFEISKELHSLLMKADGGHKVNELLAMAFPAQRQNLIEEIKFLWGRRALRMSPAPAQPEAMSG